MKIIKGHSSSNSISFSTKNVEITLFENGRCEFLSYVPTKSERKQKELERQKIIDDEKELENDLVKHHEYVKLLFAKVKYNILKIFDKIKKSKYFKLNHKPNVLICLCFICELVMIYFAYTSHMKALAIIPSIVTLAYSCTYLKTAIKAFKKQDRLRNIHGAEHMVYNTSKNLYVFNKNDIEERSTYCKNCGSTKPANQVYLEIIDLIIAIVFGIWIPHSFIFVLSLNMFGALPFNFIARWYQKFLTDKPDSSSLFLAHSCYEILRITDDLIEKGYDIDPSIFRVVVNKSIENVKKKNDYFTRT